VIRIGGLGPLSLLDVMLPFLLAFAFIGMERAVNGPRWRWAYAAYWACIFFLAAGHLLIRASI
jgi:hypothetical protein